MRDNEENHIFIGHNYEFNGFDRYGYVKSGIARYVEQMYSTERKDFNENNSVVIYANKDKLSMKAKLYDLITELASIYFAEKNNLRLSMVKAIIKASKRTADTIKSVFNANFLNPKSVVVVDDKEENLITELETIDLKVDYMAEKYQKSIIFYHNQILEMLGVNFTPHEKNERLITDEVNSNNEQTNSIKLKYMKRIQRKLDKFNNLFNQELKIEENIQKEENDEKVVDDDDENIDDKNDN